MHFVSTTTKNHSEHFTYYITPEAVYYLHETIAVLTKLIHNPFTICAHVLYEIKHKFLFMMKVVVHHIAEKSL